MCIDRQRLYDSLLTITKAEECEQCDFILQRWYNTVFVYKYVDFWKDVKRNC